MHDVFPDPFAPVIKKSIVEDTSGSEGLGEGASVNGLAKTWDDCRALAICCPSALMKDHFPSTTLQLPN